MSESENDDSSSTADDKPLMDREKAQVKVLT